MNMQKVKGLFLSMGVMLVFVLYPISSFNWYRFCKKEGDVDAKYFLGYGVAGVVGIIGFVITYMEPVSLKKIAVAIFACIPYVFGSIEQRRLIAKKQREQSSTSSGKG